MKTLLVLWTGIGITALAFICLLALIVLALAGRADTRAPDFER